MTFAAVSKKASKVEGLLSGAHGADISEFVDSDPVRWIETHFYVPELRGPLILSDYQKKALREALSEDDAGLFNYSTIVWSDIKKSIKSTVAAAVTLYRAFQVDAEQGWGSSYVIANDLKQADSRVAYYLRRAIQLNPKLRAVCRVRTGSYKVTLPNETFIEAIPIDPTGEAGSNADMVVFSELWGAHGPAAERMWTEMTLSPTKYGRSFRWVESYAGFKDKSKLLLSLYEQGVKEEQRLDPEIEMYANPAARLFCLWNTTPRLPWQTPAYYRQEEAVMAAMPEEFRRVHRNQWAEGGTERFLPAISMWDACEEKLPAVDPRTPLILAADGAYAAKGDVFGLIALSRHPQDAELAAVRDEWYWEARGKKRDFDVIQNDIKNICLALNVFEIAFDPRELHQMMTHLSKRSNADGGRDFPGVVTTEFKQGQDRQRADKNLLDLIVSRRIVHSGQPKLREHLNNADRETDKDGHIRIVKREAGKKIDLAVCASMAADRLSSLPITSVSEQERNLLSRLGGRRV